MTFPFGNFAAVKVEPTYLSTDLVTPGRLRRVTLPAIAKHSRQEEVQLPWGNESVRHHNQKIAYNGFTPSQFPSLTVDLTHKHFGTRVIRMDPVYQPYELTSLQLSKCRVNDQRLPSFNNDLIPESKITESVTLKKPDPYFSHREKFDVFPRSDSHAGRNATLENQNPIKQPSSYWSKMRLSDNTLREINKVNNSIYHTTTYMENFPKPLLPKRSSLKAGSCSNKPSKRVSFEDTVKVYDDEEMAIEELRANEEGEFELPFWKNVPAKMELQNFSAVQSPGMMPYDILQARYVERPYFCPYCGRRRQVADVRSEDCHSRTQDEIEIPQGSRGDAVREDSVADSPVSSPRLELRDVDCDSPSHQKTVTRTYGKRPRGPKRFFDVCQCEHNPQLKQSLLKAEAILKRKAANFERRNHTTISVFNKLDDDKFYLKSDDSSTRADTKRKRIKKNLISMERPLNQKTEAHERFHRKFPESAPDLRDAMRPLRRVLFCGYHSFAFR